MNCKQLDTIASKAIALGYDSTLIEFYSNMVTLWRGEDDEIWDENGNHESRLETTVSQLQKTLGNGYCFTSTGSKITISRSTGVRVADWNDKSSVLHY